jgi:DNA-binding NarL/FixJ family response regulator
MKGEIRIVIADDHPIFRQGLRLALGADSSLKIVGEAGDGESALALIRQSKPDVVILDVNMPKADGFTVARTIKDEKLPVEAIFLTMHKDEDLFNEAMDLGVKGYVLKDSAVTDIVGAVKAAAIGQSYISPSLSTYLISRGVRASSLVKKKPGLNDLTPSERRILRLIAENKTSREIAEELFISIRTVDNHRANISAKLELQGSHALLKFALEHKSELL